MAYDIAPVILDSAQDIGGLPPGTPYSLNGQQGVTPQRPPPPPAPGLAAAATRQPQLGPAPQLVQGGQFGMPVTAAPPPNGFHVSVPGLPTAPDAAAPPAAGSGQPLSQGSPLSAVVASGGVPALVGHIIQREGGSPQGVINNPGNIKFTGAPGQTDSGVRATDGGTFASYQTPEAGRGAIADMVTRAAHGQIGAYGANPTVGSFLAIYGGQGQGGGMDAYGRAYQEQSRRDYEQAHQNTQTVLAELNKASPNSATYRKLIGQALERSDELQTEFMNTMRHPPVQKPADVMSNFGSLATVIGIFGGLFSRRPLTAALNAAGAGMQAMNAGNHEAYQRAYDTWKTQTTLLHEILSEQNSQIRNVLELESIDEREKMDRINILATQFQQDRLAASAMRGDWREVIAINQQMQKFPLELKNLQAQIEQHQATAEKIREGGARDWQILVDPYNLDDKGNPINYRYRAATGEATTLSGEPYAPGGAQKMGAGAMLSPSAVQRYAKIFEETGGYLPPGLARNTKAIAQILNATDSSESPGQFIEKQATRQADAGSLKNIVKMTDAAVSFENTAIRNFDTALKLAPKAVPTDWGPWINRWVMEGETAIGRPDQPAYVTALLTAANEYAKVIGGGTGAQASTVDARREAAERFSPYLSKGQISEVVKIAKIDMENRKDELFATQDDIKDRLRSLGQQVGPTKRGHPAGGVGAEALPADLPPPGGHAEGSVARDDSGRVVAKIHNGEWVLP